MLPISGCKDRLIRRTLRRVYRFCHFCPCGKRVYPLGKRNSVSQTAGKRTVHAPAIGGGGGHRNARRPLQSLLAR